MTPSRSGNSRTSSDAWSAFASRAASRACSSPPSCADELDEPCRLVGERAAALDERDPVEPACQLVDTDCDVAVERERRVLEPRLEHTRVAGPDDVHVSPGRDDGEAVLAEREVALVALHGRDDHALGQAEEALVELRSEDERPLDHVHDLVELPERVLPVAERVERLDDEAAALGSVGLDVRGAQRVRVGLRGGDLDLAVREAVAEGRAGARQRLFVELLAEPAHGTRKAMAAVVPAHRLSELEPVDDRAHPVEQRLAAQRLAGHAGPEVPVPLLEVRLGEPVALGEACRRLLAPLGRRPLHELLGRRLRQLVDDERDPPRRHVDVRCLHAQLLEHERRELRLRLATRRGGKLLAAELKQQRRHRASPRRGAPRSA